MYIRQRVAVRAKANALKMSSLKGLPVFPPKVKVQAQLAEGSRGASTKIPMNCCGEKVNIFSLFVGLYISYVGDASVIKHLARGPLVI